MNIKKLEFHEKIFAVDIVINFNDNTFFKLGEILPTIHGQYRIESNHFIQLPGAILNELKTLSDAKIQAQELFKTWVNNFLILWLLLLFSINISKDSPLFAESPKIIILFSFY